MVVKLDQTALSRHLYVLGGTGVGKSRAMEGWIVDLIRADQGVGVIDPHGELYQNLMSRLARHGKRLYDRVILFDPLNPTYAIGFNPLELHAGEIVERKALFLATVITKLFRADPLLTARMQRILFYTFWLLMESKLTLLDFEETLTNPIFRTLLLNTVPEGHSLRRYWQREFPTQERLVKEWTQSSLNKVGALVSDPDFALILGQQGSTINFRTILDKGLILLVNLPKGVLGEANSHLMGAFLVAQMQQAALSRAAQPYAHHRPFTLFIDEFHNYATDDIHEILAETRKYCFALVMVHQFYAQLADSPKLQEAVLNTVGNLAVFRVGARDADQLLRDLFTPPLDEAKDIRVRKLPTGLSWFPYTTVHEPVWRPLDEIWEREARQLTELPNRLFWYKQRGGEPPCLLRSLDTPDIVLTPELTDAIDALVERSASLHATRKEKARVELVRRQHSQVEERVPPPFSVHEEV